MVFGVGAAVPRHNNNSTCPVEFLYLLTKDKVTRSCEGKQSSTTKRNVCCDQSSIGPGKSESRPRSRKLNSQSGMPKQHITCYISNQNGSGSRICCSMPTAMVIHIQFESSSCWSRTTSLAASKLSKAPPRIAKTQRNVLWPNMNHVEATEIGIKSPYSRSGILTQNITCYAIKRNDSGSMN